MSSSKHSPIRTVAAFSDHSSSSERDHSFVTIECCFPHPLETCSDPDNCAFMQDLLAWQHITAGLYVWDYTTDFAHDWLPSPDLDVLEPNMRTFARYGVSGVFALGTIRRGEESSQNCAHGCSHNCFGIQTTMSTMSTHSSESSWTECADWPRRLSIPISIPRTTSRAKWASMVRIYDGPDPADLPSEVLVEWDTYLSRAEELAQEDVSLLRRIERLRLPVSYALLYSAAPVDHRDYACDWRRQTVATRSHTCVKRQRISLRSWLHLSSKGIAALPPCRPTSGEMKT